ncbi:MAG: hypothetical protein WCB85_06045 [Candidatus Dormiibacterota bacterium]
MDMLAPAGPATLAVAIPPSGRRTRHYRGFPPKLTGGIDTRVDMPTAVLVLAEPDTTGGWHLRRYAADGSDAGNTWHPSWPEAVGQLEFEYVSNLIFTCVPPEADDPRSYSAALASGGGPTKA